MSTQTVPIAADDTVELEQVGGDLHVEGGDRENLQARGEGLRVERRANAVAVSSGGDLILQVPRRARILLGSVGGDVQLENLSGNVELNLVGGDATLRNLSGVVRLSGMIGGEVHLENVADMSMNSSKAGDRFNIAERVRRKVEHATRRAEAKVRGIERRGVQVSQMRGQQNDGGGWGPSTAEPVEAVSDEERMTILRMLQDRKITSEQAEKLLAALEGNA